MIIDIAEAVDSEITGIIERIKTKIPNAKQVDLHYIEFEMPFIIRECPNTSFQNKVGMVFYPELLYYSCDKNTGFRDQIVPWIACRIELENTEREKEREICKILADLFKEHIYKPFYDEDAFMGHWKRKEGKGYTKYSMYVNSAYPEGLWQNHTIE